MEEVPPLAADLRLVDDARAHAPVEGQQPPRAGREPVAEAVGAQVAERLVPGAVEVADRVVVARVGEGELAERAAVVERRGHREPVRRALEDRKPRVHEDRGVDASAVLLDPDARVLGGNARPDAPRVVVPDPESAEERARMAAVEGGVGLGLEARDERRVAPVEKARRARRVGRFAAGPLARPARAHAPPSGFAAVARCRSTFTIRFLPSTKTTFRTCSAIRAGST